MLVNGIPNKDLLQPDGIHLNDEGISLLAGNIKRAIHIALDIPPPPRRSRSKSLGRKEAVDNTRIIRERHND